LRPDAAAAYNNLGLALREAGQFDEATAALVKYLSLRPADMNTYWDLYEIGARRETEAAGANVAESESLPRLPYLGDKVVLLHCDAAARRRLQNAGLHGGNAFDPDTGANYWLGAQVLSAPDSVRLARWLDWARNEAAMAGKTCTLWLPTMPETLANALRHAAGSDLIEVSGATAEEIHARLSSRAIAPPDSENKVFAIVAIRNGGLELLPHWLDHYTRLGVDEILLGMFDDLTDVSLAEIDLLARNYRFRRFAQQWNNASETEQYAQRQSACRRSGAKPGTWIMHTDLDEFHEYPAPLREITASAAGENIDAVFGHLVDRVARDGSLPPVLPTPPLSEQFPIECDLTPHILNGVTRKVMLARFRVRVNVGHHGTPDKPVPAPPLGTAQDYRVAHHKWHGDVVERLRWGLEQKTASARWRGEARRFLAWLDRHGGRLDLSDPGLRAKDRGAGQ
jgi:hypothetical protein